MADSELKFGFGGSTLDPAYGGPKAHFILTGYHRGQFIDERSLEVKVGAQQYRALSDGRVLVISTLRVDECTVDYRLGLAN
jgi:hypothetical protein